MSDEIYTESWFSDNKQQSVRYALDHVFATGAYIEIGSFEGMSTVFIANKIFPKKLHAVDTWAGGEHAPYEQMKYATTPIESNFDNNIKVATEGNVLKQKMDWLVFIGRILRLFDSTIAFIYIDGPHDYDSVLHSLETIRPLMAKGGVMCGDDYDDPSVKAAVNDFFSTSVGDVVEDLGPTWVVRT